MYDLAKHTRKLTFGKRLPTAVYIHRCAVPLLAEPLQVAIAAAFKLADIEDSAVDVVKLSTRNDKLSLLAYPSFFEEAFPTLGASWAADLATGTVSHRDYAKTGNPPILHRKETLLPPGHPQVHGWSKLTRRAEALGLYQDATRIGHLRQWEATLEACGVEVVDHELCIRETAAQQVPRPTTAPAPSVQRYRTAMSRFGLSRPIQALAAHGYLDGEYSIFDYGCGRGDDVAALRSRGIQVAGWDPHFEADEPIVPADIVNLGFVLNVIENPSERAHALHRAYELTGKLLAVAVLVGSRSDHASARSHGDGVLTSRDTFQKYFGQEELRAYLESTLGREPIAVGRGLFFVFRTDEDEQGFLAQRQRQRYAGLHPAWRNLRVPRPLSVGYPRRLPGSKIGTGRGLSKARWEGAQELLDEFWTAVLDLGRLPAEDEFNRLAAVAALAKPATVLGRLIGERGESELEQAQAARTDDLLVYLALNLFERRRSFSAHAPRTQRDIRALLGSYKRAQAEARDLLFSIGKPDVILEACKTAAEAGIGHLDAEHSLTLHSSLVPELPAVLRVYVGCAARLHGEVEEADLVKVHITSGKVSVMTYDDFETSPLPLMRERVKIRMRRQDIVFFDYADRESRPVLYFKARYLPESFPGYAGQVEFDRRMQGLHDAGEIDLSGYGPDTGDLRQHAPLLGLELPPRP